MAEDQELWERARKRAAEKSAFYYHLVAYAVLNFMFVFLWLFTGAGSNYWPVWLMVFWGIALAFHGAYVFVGEGYIRRETRREYERLRSRE